MFAKFVPFHSDVVLNYNILLHLFEDCDHRFIKKKRGNRQAERERERETLYKSSPALG